MSVSITLYLAVALSVWLDVGGGLMVSTGKLMELWNGSTWHSGSVTLYSKLWMEPRGLGHSIVLCTTDTHTHSHTMHTHIPRQKQMSTQRVHVNYWTSSERLQRDATGPGFRHIEYKQKTAQHERGSVPWWTVQRTDSDKDLSKQQGENIKKVQRLNLCYSGYTSCTCSSLEEDYTNTRKCTVPTQAGERSLSTMHASPDLHVPTGFLLVFH